jgi:hypothetical protein
MLTSKPLTADNMSHWLHKSYEPPQCHIHKQKSLSVSLRTLVVNTYLLVAADARYSKPVATRCSEIYWHLTVKTPSTHARTRLLCLSANHSLRLLKLLCEQVRVAPLSRHSLKIATGPRPQRTSRASLCRPELVTWDDDNEERLAREPRRGRGKARDVWM